MTSGATLRRISRFHKGLIGKEFYYYPMGIRLADLGTSNSVKIVACDNKVVTVTHSVTGIEHVVLLDDLTYNT